MVGPKWIWRLVTRFRRNVYPSHGSSDAFEPSLYGGMLLDRSILRPIKINMPVFWSLLTLAGVHLLAVASPGPAFVSIVQTSTSNPRRITVVHVLGLGAAIFVWATAAVFGMQALLARVAWLYRFLEVGGGLYLLYVGIQSIRHAKDRLITGVDSDQIALLTPFQAFRRGFTTNFANP